MTRRPAKRAAARASSSTEIAAAAQRGAPPAGPKRPRMSNYRNLADAQRAALEHPLARANTTPPVRFGTLPDVTVMLSVNK